VKNTNGLGILVGMDVLIEHESINCGLKLNLNNKSTDTYQNWISAIRKF
jgi:hypothetical protein